MPIKPFILLFAFLAIVAPAPAKTLSPEENSDLVFQSTRQLTGQRTNLTSVSANGQVVAGNYVNEGHSTAFRFSKEDGFQTLPTDLPPETEGVWSRGVSLNGGLVYGHLQYNTSEGTILEGFVWTAELGFVRVGLLPGSKYSVCTAASPDGQTVIGQTVVDSENAWFSWNAEQGIRRLDQEFPGFPDGATAPVHVSNDIRSVWANTWSNGSSVLRWENLGEPIAYTDLPGGNFDNLKVITVNPDGNPAFGRGNTETGFRAVRFFPSGKIDPLFPDARGQNIAADATADGRIVINHFSQSTDPNRFSSSDTIVLDLALGEFQLLSELIAEHVPLASGWEKVVAFGISDDADTLVGTGIDSFGHPDSWILRGARKYLVTDEDPVFLPSFPGVILANKAADGTSIDLTSFLRDSDSIESMTWSIKSVSRPEIFDSLELDVSSGELKVNYNPWQWGASTAVIQVSGPDGAFAERMITFEVPELPTPGIETTPKLILNYQTGLFEHTVTVTNRAAREIAGFDLTVSGLSGDVCLYNASDCTRSSWKIQHHSPLAAGESVSLILEYYSPTRGEVSLPWLTVTPVPEPAITEVPAEAGIVVDRCLVIDSGVLIEFVAQSGSLYEIQYSDNASDWKLSPIPIRAAGNRVQWIDRGPPRTDSPPADKSSRFYRVREISSPENR